MSRRPSLPSLLALALLIAVASAPQAMATPLDTGGVEKPTAKATADQDTGAEKPAATAEPETPGALETTDEEPAGVPARRRPRSPFNVNLPLDLAITIGTSAFSIVPVLIEKELPGPHCGLECDPNNINALDRTVVGNDSVAARHTADALLATSLVLPHVLGIIDVAVSDPADGWSGWGKDTLVLLETVSINNLIFQVAKYGAPRPRPYVYDHGVDPDKRQRGDAALSFYSGHTAQAFGMATAYSYLFQMRHPDSALVIPVWISTHALAATVGTCQVLGGRHFWTDVMVGALIGSSVGLAVPWLHRRAGSDPGGVTVTAVPTVSSQGGMLNLSFQF